MKYFEVFYPEGNKGVFGYTTNSINELYLSNHKYDRLEWK